MAIIEPTQIKDILGKNQTLLGVDLGTKNIGISVSDSMLFSATPLTTIRHEKFTKTAEELFEIIKEKNVGVLVIGLPINMNGTEGPKCQATRDFANNLLQSDIFPTELSIVFQDERMSTCAVERTMIEANLSRKRRKEVIDKSASSFILQGILDRLRNL
jgi:putative Holliday junction resolvase